MAGILYRQTLKFAFKNKLYLIMRAVSPRSSTSMFQHVHMHSGWPSLAISICSASDNSRKLLRNTTQVHVVLIRPNFWYYLISLAASAHVSCAFAFQALFLANMTTTYCIHLLHLKCKNSTVCIILMLT